MRTHPDPPGQSGVARLAPLRGCKRWSPPSRNSRRWYVAYRRRNPGAEDEQRTCVLRFGQRNIAGSGTESTSTCCRRVGRGGDRNLHEDENWI
jgi:hypothetical protein